MSTHIKVEPKELHPGTPLGFLRTSRQLLYFYNWRDTQYTKFMAASLPVQLNGYPIRQIHDSPFTYTIEGIPNTPTPLRLLRTSWQPLYLYNWRDTQYTNSTKVTKNFMVAPLPVHLKGYPVQQLHTSSVCCTLELLGIFFLKEH